MEAGSRPAYNQAENAQNSNAIRKQQLHCVQKKTPTHIFFHISMSDV